MKADEQKEIAPMAEGMLAIAVMELLLQDGALLGMPLAPAL